MRCVRASCLLGLLLALSVCVAASPSLHSQKQLKAHASRGPAAHDSKDSFALTDSSSVRIYSFQPSSLLHVSHLWSVVVANVTCDAPGFTVSYANSWPALMRHLDAKDAPDAPVDASLGWFTHDSWSDEASHLLGWLLSDSKQEMATDAFCWWPWEQNERSCAAKLEVFGEKGSWLPRIHWGPSHETLIAIQASDTMACTIELRQESKLVTHVLLFAAGLLLYRNAKTLGSSLKLYLLSWFVAGTIFSGVAIALVLMYFVAKQLRLSRMGVVNGIAAVMVLSWSSLLVSARSFVPSFYDLASNKILVCLMLMGGLVGFIRGYKSELSQENKDVMQILFKIIAVVLIYWSTEHPEVSLILVLLVSAVDSSMYLRYIRLCVMLPIQIILAPFRIVISIVKKLLGIRPYKTMLTEEEYMTEAKVATAAGLESLVQAIRDDPRQIAMLSGEAQRMVGRLLRGEDHLGIVMDVATNDLR